MWTGETEAKTVRVDANFFANGERVAFSKEYGYLWTWPKAQSFRTKILHFLGGENQAKPRFEAIGLNAAFAVVLIASTGYFLS